MAACFSRSISERRFVMNKVFIFIALCVLCFNDANAGEVEGSLDIGTGDSELDITLGDLNITAGDDIEGFKAKMRLSFGKKKEDINELIEDFEMEPSDVYLTLEIANITGKKIKEVSEEFKKNRGKGWGVMAKNLGIKPGSKKFHELKKSGKDELKSMKNKGKKGKGRNKNKAKKIAKGKKKKKQHKNTNQNRKHQN